MSGGDGRLAEDFHSASLTQAGSHLHQVRCGTQFLLGTRKPHAQMALCTLLTPPQVGTASGEQDQG